jgi:hypothetical protein
VEVVCNPDKAALENNALEKIIELAKTKVVFTFGFDFDHAAKIRDAGIAVWVLSSDDAVLDLAETAGEMDQGLVMFALEFKVGVDVKTKEDAEIICLFD